MKLKYKLGDEFILKSNIDRHYNKVKLLTIVDIDITFQNPYVVYLEGVNTRYGVSENTILKFTEKELEKYFEFKKINITLQQIILDYNRLKNIMED